MAHQIAFHQETYKPKTIEGNEESADPVAFDLSAVGSPSLVLLKGMLYGSSVLAFNLSPGPKELEAASEGLRTAGPAFVEGVDAVRGLSVPDALARRVGLRKPEDKAAGAYEIHSGAAFARVAPFVPELGMEIGFRLSTMSDSHGAGRDHRVFDSPTTSPDRPARKSGTVRGVRRTKGRGETADSQGPTGK